MSSRGQGARRGGGAGAEPGHALAVLLVGIAVMSILMSVAMPVWKQAVQREKEQELVFRGEQYARAIGLFQRKFAGAFPPSIDVLVEQRFLRKKYKDPMTTDGDFQVLYATAAGQQPGLAPAGSAQRPGLPAAPQLQPGTVGSGQQTVFGGGNLAGPRGGIIGVASKSKDKSIRLYRGRSRYNEWQFVYSPVTLGPGVPGGVPRPGIPGTARPGQIGPGTSRPGQPTRPTGSGFPSPGTATRPGSSPFGPGGMQPPRP